MPDSKTQTNIIRLRNNNIKFFAHTSKIIFEGFKKVYNLDEDGHLERDNNRFDVEKIKVGDVWKEVALEVKEKSKNPPPRYTQASLIKKLEEEGVGRPSTYASMAHVAVDPTRNYAHFEGRSMVLNHSGKVIIEGLAPYFPEILDAGFTKNMEEHLDDIAKKTEGWKEWVLDYQKKFFKEVDEAQNMPPPPLDYVVDENNEKKICPKCGKPLVHRYTRFGAEFIACSGFPECEYHIFPGHENDKPAIPMEEICPKCGKHLIKRWNHTKEEYFIACSGFPKCHYTRPDGYTHEEYEKYKEELILEREAEKAEKAKLKEAARKESEKKTATKSKTSTKKTSVKTSSKKTPTKTTTKKGSSTSKKKK